MGMISLLSVLVLGQQTVGASEYTHLTTQGLLGPGCDGSACVYYYFDTGSVPTVASLTSHAKFPSNPDDVMTVTGELRSPRENFADSYGAMIEAWITVPESGPYVFFTHSDDNSEVWLALVPGSTKNLQKVVEETGCCVEKTGGTSFDLVAGSTYYLKGVFKENGGGDYFKIGYQRVGGQKYMPIPEEYFGKRTGNITPLLGRLLTLTDEQRLRMLVGIAMDPKAQRVMDYYLNQMSGCSCDERSRCESTGGHFDEGTCTCNHRPEPCHPDALWKCEEHGGKFDFTNCQCHHIPEPCDPEAQRKCEEHGGKFDFTNCQCHHIPEPCQPEAQRKCEEHGGKFDWEQCECHHIPEPCDPEATRRCQEEGGEFDSRNCNCYQRLSIPGNCKQHRYGHGKCALPANDLCHNYDHTQCSPEDPCCCPICDEHFKDCIVFDTTTTGMPVTHVVKEGEVYQNPAVPCENRLCSDGDFVVTAVDCPEEIPCVGGEYIYVPGECCRQCVLFPEPCNTEAVAICEKQGGEYNFNQCVCVYRPDCKPEEIAICEKQGGEYNFNQCVCVYRPDDCNSAAYSRCQTAGGYFDQSDCSCHFPEILSVTTVSQQQPTADSLGTGTGTAIDSERSRGSSGARGSRSSRSSSDRTPRVRFAQSRSARSP